MGIPPTTPERLAAFIRRIAVVRSYPELLEFVRQEVSQTTGYHSAWLGIGNKENPTELELLEVDASSDTLEATIRQHANRFKVPGDMFLESIISSMEPVIIVDARLDPRTDKAMVELLQNRTLINFPLRLVGAPFGLFGVGTFGEEGCKAPSSDELHYLSQLAVEIAIAVGRLMLNAERESAHKSRVRATLVYVASVDTLRFNTTLSTINGLQAELNEVQALLQRCITMDSLTFVRFVVYLVVTLVNLAVVAYFLLEFASF